MSVSSNWQKIKNRVYQINQIRVNESVKSQYQHINLLNTQNQEEVSSINKLCFDNIERDSLRIGKLNHQAKIEKYVSIDCEIVGVGSEDERSVLAQVTVVNYHGVVILDKYVRPTEYVTDFRTDVSGITSRSLVNSYDFKNVQLEVANIIKNQIVVGHALYHDFK
ncbi:30564_t:CDS:2, partial [Gigaspora margarita]